MRRLTAENVTYIYQGKYQKVEALKEVSCTFEEGKLYAVIGQSGRESLSGAECWQMGRISAR